MKGKIVIILLGMFLLSGCTVEYNASITKNEVLENITINGLVNDDFPITAYINEQGASETDEKIPGLNYYEIIQNGDIRTLKFNFPFNHYRESRAINTCYKNIQISMTNNNYQITTDNFNSCLNFYNDIDQLNINLNFTNDFVVNKSNADQVNKNVYTWHINRENYQNKPIEISFTLTEKDSSTTKNSPLNKIIILSSLLGFTIFLIMIIKMKNRKWKEKR